MAELTGRVALVTGGTSGIGRATAIALGRAGAKVVVTGRRVEEGSKTVALVKAAGGDAQFFQADHSREQDSRAAVEAVLKAYGRLDAAFNNAGTEGVPMVLTHEQTEENYRRVMDLNVAGVLWSMKYEVPAMLKNGGGSIVNNASVAGMVGMPGMSVYVASKHAVMGLSRCAALEYGKQGIRVNIVSPGGVETDMFDRFVGKPEEQTEARRQIASMHPVGRTGKAEEIASAVVWLCSPGAAFVNGSNIAIDGGWTAQ